ncbi:MAG TPA: hypothetical protein DHV42_03660 [Lachnospiraceae bacterium]|nr:hypothetical protein [Lachnospiraceae bacterium]
MKKNQLFATTVICAALAIGTAAMPAFAEETGADMDSSRIQVYTGKTYEYEWSDEEQCYIAESTCPQVKLDEAAEKSYPKLAEAFRALNKQKKQDADKNFQEMLEEARERFRETPDYTGTYTDMESWYTARADQVVVSLLGLRTGYAGGAHGYESFSCVNLIPDTGEELKLSEIVKDEAAFREKAKEAIYSSYPEVEKDLTEEYFKNTALDDMIWTAGYEGITCYFNAYTFGAYALGSQQILLPYGENAFLDGRLSAGAAQSYGIEFPMNTPVKTSGREITVFGTRGEYDSYESISICVNGETTEFDDDIFTYSIDPVYLRANGEDYLYLQCTSDNDYWFLDIYHLGEKPERIGSPALGKSGIYTEEEDFTARAAMTDPENLRLSARTHLLGTNSAECLYRVGADGMPEAKEAYMALTEPRILTTKVERSFAEVDEEGKQIGSVTLPAGTSLTPFRTDNETVVDLHMEDGKIVRVELQKDETSRTADGTAAEDIFDGMLFAG